MLSALEQQILKALEELDERVRALSAAQPKPDLLPHLLHLDELTRQLPRETHPDLRHYLQRKSYEKARLWLLGRGSENARGQCGGSRV